MSKTILTTAIPGFLVTTATNARYRQSWNSNHAIILAIALQSDK